ncbi:Ala-tRNA(Pro) hydrolase [Faunimonas pinastri]|uniref:Ala-tRNA(Pro) hydrolase n=1 Tax=Faunimonas pinastri TaxID=1855383 RepID=A0A1H9GT60_9HYPH|nr:prolyl-tRNA synthetase associated domain-containing protein [Faunimonas pinastri]SEQ53255.1 Ala-tRNA(Pro) hydrolase [Faunimonas pinastri]
MTDTLTTGAPTSPALATRAGLFAFLDRLGISTSTIEHPPLHTVAESQALRGTISGGHSKNLFLKDAKGELFLLVAEEDRPIDMKTLHKRIGSARLSFGKPELMAEVLGVQPGSVTPFAALCDTEKRVTIFLEAGLMAHEVMNFHPLENTATTTIRRDDLLAFLRATGHEPHIVDVSTEI